jgi:predicted HicB family RNase H-like nuclease
MKKPPTKPARQLIRLDLEPASHQDVRVAAARSGLSMAEFARQAVTDAARKVNAK